MTQSVLHSTEESAERDKFSHWSGILNGAALGADTRSDSTESAGAVIGLTTGNGLLRVA